MSNLISEIKRRRVFKVATAYLIGGWIVVQIADVLREPTKMPDWVFLSILGVVGLGFLLTVALAWTFDMTSEGVRRTAGEADAQIQSLSTGRKIDFVIIGLLVIALVAFATKDQWFTATLGDSVGVAVLPFASFSSDEENQHFADGLSEELLNILGNIQGLNVPGRTSVFYYKDRNMDLREIAEELNVGHILEGSVRRSGNEVKITAQLIRADDGFHVWSRDYDEELDDIFGIQEDVARSVADALKVTLLGEDEEQLAKRHDANPAAHNLYLVARNRQSLRGQNNLVGAMEFYEKIVDEHPDFAPAYSGLAESILLLANNHFYFTNEQARDRAKPLIDKALELAPDSAATWRAKGFLNAHIDSLEGGESDYFRLAQADYEKALAIDPEEANTLYWYGILMDDVGQRDRAIELYNRSLKFDPLARVPRYRLGQMYQQLGQYDRAREELRETIELYPDFATAVEALGGLEFNAGNFAAAEKLLTEVAEGGSGSNTWFNLFSFYLNAGDYESAAATINRIDSSAFNAQIIDNLRGMLRAVLSRNTAGIVENTDALLEDENTTQQWIQLSAIAHLLAGNDDAARERLEQLLPDLFTDDPSVNGQTAINAVMAAVILRRAGDDDHAERLLDAAQAALETAWPDFRPPQIEYRFAEIEALRGNNDAAMALLNGAYDKGFRQPWLDIFFPMTDNPRFGDLPDDERFKALVAKIEASNEIARQDMAGLSSGD